MTTKDQNYLFSIVKEIVKTFNVMDNPIIGVDGVAAVYLVAYIGDFSPMPSGGH